MTGVRATAILVTACFLAILITGCSSNNVRIIRLGELLNSYQDKHQCGPNSLSIIMRYWGVDKTPSEIASEIYHPAMKGTYSLSMLLYAKSSGLGGFLYKGAIDDIREKIDNGYPMLLALKRGDLPIHFVVVYGYRGDEFIIHDGLRMAVSIKQDELDNLWRSAGNMALWIYPESQAGNLSGFSGFSVYLKELVPDTALEESCFLKL